MKELEYALGDRREAVGKMIETTYKAFVQRSGDFWIISVPAIRGLHTQALSEDSIEFMTRDAISLMMESEPSSFDLEFEFI
jgi:predicted RNase H-like HicB family nuclease